MSTEQGNTSALGTVYDRTVRALHGVPDVSTVKPATIRTMHPVLEISQTFIVQTYRKAEAGDTIAIEYVDTNGAQRIALPPAVADCIARQREALTTKRRKAAGRAEAARRKAAGIKPAFLRPGTKRGKRKPATKRGKRKPAKEGGAA